MLAKHNIEQTSYWNVHNDISERDGNYGIFPELVCHMETEYHVHRTGHSKWQMNVYMKTSTPIV